MRFDDEDDLTRTSSTCTPIKYMAKGNAGKPRAMNSEMENNSREREIPLCVLWQVGQAL